MKFTYTRCRLNTTDSADDEHRGARNMYRIGINIYEKRIVPRVGYLQEKKKINLHITENTKYFHCNCNF